MLAETGTRPAGAPSPVRRRRRAWTAVRLCLSAVLVAYLLHRAGVHAILHRVATADVGWLAVGYGVAALSILATVGQWWSLLRVVGLRRSLGRCLHCELAGDVFDAALPTSVGGDVLRAGFVSQARTERPVAACSVLLRRLCNFPGMVVVLVAGLAVSAPLGYATRIEPYAVAAAAAGVTGTVVCFSPLLGRMARLRRLERGRAGRFAREMLTALDAFRARRRQLLWAGLRGLAFWCLAGISQWSFMRAVGVDVPLSYGLLVVTTTTAITMLPISVGGYGLREGSFSAFLAVGGLATTAQGVAVGVCITVQTLFLGLVGVPFYLTLGRPARRAPSLVAAGQLGGVAS